MQKIQKSLAILLCGLFLLTALVSCEVFSTGAETQQKTTLAETVFKVTLSEPVNENESLYLEILDEVTGIALNPTRYAMEAKDNLSYFVRIPLTIGSLQKYRYVRQGTDVNLIERDTFGNVVQYRLAAIKKPAVIKDLIAGWEEKAYAGKTGEISGYVYDQKTEAPLGEIMICLNGLRTFSSSDGYFELKNVPLGEFNLVAYHPDGKYKVFQQGAVIAENSVTPASFGIEPAKFVKVTFVATPPAGQTTSGTLRFISNLYSQGNTLNENSGGVSVLASQAPAMALQSNGTYTLTLEIPEGFDLQYKYSLGDGFLNAERYQDGSYRIRQLLVPGHDLKVKNSIETWFSSGSNAVTFNLTVPENTPANDQISIQFNPFVWMEPIPMQQVSGNKWTFTLYNPQEYLNGAQFRFCRNAQCGLADDVLTTGPTAPGYILNLEDTAGQSINYALEKWAGLTQSAYTFKPVSIPANNIYIKAIELSKKFSKKDMAYFDWGIVNAAVNGANMLMITPTWTFPAASNAGISLRPGSDLMQPDLDEILAFTKETNLTPALYPQPRFTSGSDEYWYQVERSYNWWVDWFQHYERFILHYADYAELNGIQTLVIGGSTVSPAFPEGKLANGNASNSPFDAEDLWSALIQKVRSRFTGQLFFALPYSSNLNTSYGFIEEVDAVYVEMNAALTTSESPSVGELRERFSAILDDDIYNLYATYRKPLILALNYASIDGSASNCLNFSNSCEKFIRSESNPYSGADLEEQALVYQAIIGEAVQRDWIYGLVSQGYNPSVLVEDHSWSTYGKPAGVVLSHYFNSLVR